MSNMKNRTTVSVKEQVRDAARDVKDDHGESWNDVIRFYAEHRGKNCPCPTAAVLAATPKR